MYSAKRWLLLIQDTGPGFPVSGSVPLTSALTGKPQTSGVDRASVPAGSGVKGASSHGPAEPAGEGIGLSIVKRLCDMLNATVEVKSAQGAGTTFQVRFPRQYS